MQDFWGEILKIFFADSVWLPVSYGNMQKQHSKAAAVILACTSNEIKLADLVPARSSTNNGVAKIWILFDRLKMFGILFFWVISNDTQNFSKIYFLSNHKQYGDHQAKKSNAFNRQWDISNDSYSLHSIMYFSIVIYS